MSENTYVPSLIVTQAVASLETSINEDLNVEDPDLETGRAALKNANGQD